MADIARIIEVVEPEVVALGFDLVRVMLFGQGDERTLQIMAERPDTRQLTIDDCADLSRRISDRLDAQLPAWAAIAFLIVGPMITIGLSWCELRELRTRYGVQLRTQLPPDWLLSAATR